MSFFVGIASFRLDLAICSSLKDKRHFIRSITDRLGRSRLQCAAEVGDEDFWKSGEIGLACVSSSRKVVVEAIASARRIIEGSGVEVVDVEQWIIKPEDI